MKVFVTAFGIPKAGNTQEEMEDAYYPEYKDRKGELQGILLPFAIADGASEGMLSGKWAKFLVRIFFKFKANGIDPIDFLDRAYAAWNSWKRKFLHEREREKKPFKWYEQRGLQTGAFSTFLGFTLMDCGQWEAIAVGDSCLFHIRNESLKGSFPIGHSSEFNNRPLLLSSRRAEKNNILEAVKRTIGDWQIDDEFYLITDALACWFLEQREMSQFPWKILRDLDTCDQKQSFEEWIGELRAKKKIRNDDITLIRINIIP